MKNGNSKDFGISKICVMAVLIAFSHAWLGVSWAQEKPQYGGELIFAVGDEPPSYDGHRESTFAVIHPVSPHYSLLLKFDQDNYPTIVGDLAESWIISEDHKTYTFKIHKGVKFHDGSTLTAKDVKASYDKIIFPASGLMSMRKAFYAVVEKVEASDDHTVIFRLKWPSASFMAGLASPWNYIYKAEILARDPRWYEKNIMGTGPFKFVEHVAGSHWIAKRNEDYFKKGRPYLDGYRAIFIRDTAARVAAVRTGRVQAEFRYFTQSQREDVVRAMGDKIQVEECPLISTLTVIFNCEKKPFDDPRVRRALTLAMDRWKGSKALSLVSTLKWVGGLLRPGSEYSMTEGEITQLAGFGKDIEAARKEARRLLREAKIPEGFSFELINRGPPMPYEATAIWVIDQWRQVGLNVKQKIYEVGSHYKVLQAGNFGASIYTITDYMDEPDLLLTRFLSSDKSIYNYGRYKDPVLDELYLRQGRAVNFAERKILCNQYEKRVLDEMAYGYPVAWMHRISLHSSKMKGWKILSSHFLNQDLTDVWLERD